jgi:hypothetical protein
MTVGAISNSALLDSSQNVGASSWQTRMQQALGPVAQLFGESAQQLMSDLQSAKTSVSALAQSKGISQTALVAAIKQGLQQSSANGGPQLSDTQLTNLANTIANRVHGHHHHGGGMSGVNSALGTSTSGASGVGSDSDGDNDGSGGAGSAGVTGTSASASSLQTDVERLMFDLQTMQQSSTASTASSNTASANSTSAWSTASSANLLNQLSQFDQTL